MVYIIHCLKQQYISVPDGNDIQIIADIQLIFADLFDGSHDFRNFHIVDILQQNQCLFLDPVKFLAGSKHSGTANVAPGKSSADFRLIIRDLHGLHQIFFHQLICHRAHVQNHTPALNGGQQCLQTGGQDHDDAVFRRLLQGLQQCILCLHGHLLALTDDINLVRTAVRLDGHIIVDLGTDVVYTDGVGLFMYQPDNIRLILRECLLTGTAFLTGLNPLTAVLLFTLQRHGKELCYKFFSRTALAVDNICMGNFSQTDRILQMLFDRVLPDDV